MGAAPLDHFEQAGFVVHEQHSNPSLRSLLGRGGVRGTVAV